MDTTKAIIFYYFLKRSFDNFVIKTPYITFDFLGNVGEFIEFDGVGYIIEDYAVEPVYVEE